MLGLARRRARRWPPAAPRVGCVARAGRPPVRPRPSACPTGVPAPHGRASSTASSRTPSTTTTPTCPRCCTPARPSCPAALAAAEHAGATGARRRRARSPSASRSCVRLGMAGYDEDAGNSVFFEHGQHATSICGAMGGAVAAALLDAALGRRPGSLDALGVDRVDGRRASSRPTAPAAPSSGCTAAGPPTPRSRPPTWSGAASPVRRPCSRAGSASSRRGCTAQFDLDAVTDGLGEPVGGPAASSSSPTRPTTSPTPSSTPAAALRARGVAPDDVESVDGRRPGRQPAHDRRADRGQARAGDRLPGAVLRRRTPSRSGLLGGGGLGASPRRLRPTRWSPGPGPARTLMAPVDVEPDDECCDAIFPHQFPAVVTRAPCTTARSWRRRCSPTAAARSGRCRSTSSPTKFRDNVGRRPRPTTASTRLAEARAATSPTSPDRTPRSPSTPSPDARPDREEDCMSTYDLLITDAEVVRARRGRPRRLDIGVTRRQVRRDRGAGSTRPTAADGRRRRPATPRSPASSTPTSTGASTTRCAEDAVSESRAVGAGRRHHRAHLHAHRRSTT